MRQVVFESSNFLGKQVRVCVLHALQHKGAAHQAANRTRALTLSFEALMNAARRARP